MTGLVARELTCLPASGLEIALGQRRATGDDHDMLHADVAEGPALRVTS